jgi:hypothetical protein
VLSNQESEVMALSDEMRVVDESLPADLAVSRYGRRVSNFRHILPSWISKVAQLEAEVEQWRIEAGDEYVDIDGRPMTKMEHAWMDEKSKRHQLEAEVERLREERDKYRKEWIDVSTRNNG